MSYHVPEFLEVLDAWSICMENAFHFGDQWLSEQKKGFDGDKVDIKSEQMTALETYGSRGGG